MKTKFTKRVCLFLALIMVVLTIPISAGAYGFSDIASTYQYLDQVNYVSDNGFMIGTSSTVFNPNTNANRAMFITVLHEKAGAPSVSGPNPFTDVPAGEYYTQAVLWGVQQGIVSGTTATTFSPYQNVSRQQAMAFLYRFAGRPSVSSSEYSLLSAYSDYNTVESYATAAMAWAISHDLIVTSGNLLSPFGNFSRANLAYAVTKYGTNVEKIIVGKDNFGFINSSSYFTTSNYFLTTSHYNKLKAAYQSVQGSSSVSTLNDRRNAAWGGSCYGMSVVVALDKLGKIAFNENYSSAAEMNGISSIRGTRAESAINYYQLAYSLIGGGGRQTVSQIPSVMTTCMNAKGPCLLSYYYYQNGTSNPTGHSVLVNSCTLSGSTYTLKICNPNNRTVQQTATLTTAGVFSIQGVSGSTKTLIELEVIPNFDIFNSIDIDGYTNNDTTALSSLQYGEELPAAAVSSNGLLATKAMGVPFSTLTVALVDDFTITNDKGETLSVTGVDINGTMKVYNSRLIASGEGSVVFMEIDVPESKGFTFKTASNSENAWFSVADDIRYARVSGRQIGKVAVDDGHVTLEGDALDFELAYSTPDEDSPLFVTSGRGNGVVTVDADSKALVMKGVDNEYTVTAVDKNADLGKEIIAIPLDSLPDVSFPKAPEGEQPVILSGLMNGFYTFTNAEGESVGYNENFVVGDMTIYRCVIPPAFVCTMSVDVPASRSFTFESQLSGSSAKEADASVIGPDWTWHVWGRTKVTFEKDRLVLEGEGSEFKLWYRTGDPDEPYFVVSAKGEGRVVVTGSAEGLVLEGVDEPYTVEKLQL